MTRVHQLILVLTRKQNVSGEMVEGGNQCQMMADVRALVPYWLGA